MGTRNIIGLLDHISDDSDNCGDSYKVKVSFREHSLFQSRPVVGLNSVIRRCRS